jgi:hypothetical protein
MSGSMHRCRATIHAVQLCCGRSGHAGRWKHAPQRAALHSVPSARPAAHHSPKQEPRPDSQRAGSREPSRKRTQQPRGSTQINTWAPKVFLGGWQATFGLVTSAVKRGVNLLKICDQTRHKSVEMLRVYCRDAELFNGNAAASLL